jgi:hypothetical protein
MGQRMRQQLATLCVASSLAMIALGGSHLSSGFRLRTLSFSRPPPPSHRGGRWGYGCCTPCCHSEHDVRGVGEAAKLSLPSPLLRLRGPSRSTTDTTGFRASGHPCTPLYPFAPSTILSIPPFPCLKKNEGRKEERAKKKENRRKYRDLEGVAFPSLSHGGAGLDSFHHYARPPAKTHEAWVYGGD